MQLIIQVKNQCDIAIWSSSNELQLKTNVHHRLPSDYRFFSLQPNEEKVVTQIVIAHELFRDFCARFIEFDNVRKVTFFAQETINIMHPEYRRDTDVPTINSVEIMYSNGVSNRITYNQDTKEIELT